jgi:hypothetical protein
VSLSLFPKNSVFLLEVVDDLSLLLAKVASKRNPATVEMDPKSGAWCQCDTPSTCHDTLTPAIGGFIILVRFQKDPAFGYQGTVGVEKLFFCLE